MYCIYTSYIDDIYTYMNVCIISERDELREFSARPYRVNAYRTVRNFFIIFANVNGVLNSLAFKTSHDRSREVPRLTEHYSRY